MSEFGVTPGELANAGSAVARGQSELDAAESSVRGTSGAAAGTPAAGAYDALVDHAAGMLASVHTAVEDLSSALGRAAANYTHAEQSATSSLGPGAR